MRKKSLLLSALVVAILFSCKKETKQDDPATEKVQGTPSADEVFMGEDTRNAPQPGAYVPNEVLVKFKTGASANTRSDVLARISGSIAEKVVTKTMERSGDREGFFVVHTSLSVFDAIAKMRGSAIEYAEPNYIYTYGAVSNDTYYTNGSLWGMYGDGTTPANQFGSQAGEAWGTGHTGSSSVVVGIVDEGAMYSHEDLNGNFWVNPFDPVDGKDNDGNGYVDDVRGWDFVSNDNSTFDGTTDDHGTHVAGTIGAKGGNAKGVAGINWNITMISAKFLGFNGGTTANAVKAVDYITDLKARHGLNIVATNNSWGGGGFSQALQDAITRAGNANILFIAAAGNNTSNNDTNPSYPASYSNSNIIAVASITSFGDLSSFSNYGATSVDIGAPGSGIYSTLPGSGKGKTVTSSYGSYSGTSMATPHVTGAAALYKANNPNATAAQVKAAILNNAVPTSSLTGKCVTNGRLNVSRF